MATNYATAIYQPRLEHAQAFQDYLARQLLPEGIVLINLQSRSGQYDVGENLLGLEIKFDMRLSETGNFFIEIAERSSPDRPSFVPSGIRREDNSWLYGIGNYREFFIFSKRYLRTIQPDRHLVENATKTARGFLLPRIEAAASAERMFAWPDRTPDGK